MQRALELRDLAETSGVVTQQPLVEFELQTPPRSIVELCAVKDAAPEFECAVFEHVAFDQHGQLNSNPEVVLERHRSPLDVLCDTRAVASVGDLEVVAAGGSSWCTVTVEAK